MSPAANSSRWCPTPEQLMILEEMYRAGTRTPNASQIQQITAHLSFYGKIEGKNVFYWFQNHKARDRQKLRRKLYKQLQQQQQQQQQQLMINSIHHQNHHFLSYIESPTPNISSASSSCSSSTSFHQQLSFYNSSPSACSIPQFQACGLEDDHHASTHHHQPMSCYSWKMEIPLEKENSTMRMYDRDRAMMVDVGPPNSPQCYNNNKPLKTLELFPITATNLKEECSTTSKHVPHSTATTN